MATCGIIELEILPSARSHTGFIQTRATRSLAFPLVPIVQADFDRAIDVMEELASRGVHRAAGPPDLLIAAVAERMNLSVLHYDADYDIVTTTTGQPMQWVAPRGTVP